jgi:hypothetical protein
MSFDGRKNIIITDRHDIAEILLNVAFNTNPYFTEIYNIINISFGPSMLLEICLFTVLYIRLIGHADCQVSRYRI